MKRILVAGGLAAFVLASAAPASAHLVVVTPPGNGEGTRQHIGQAPPAHNSCAGHNTAGSREWPPAVTFLGPPTCPP